MRKFTVAFTLVLSLVGIVLSTYLYYIADQTAGLQIKVTELLGREAEFTEKNDAIQDLNTFVGLNQLVNPADIQDAYAAYIQLEEGISGEVVVSFSYANNLASTTTTMPIYEKAIDGNPNIILNQASLKQDQYIDEFSKASHREHLAIAWLIVSQILNAALVCWLSVIDHKKQKD